ncbi:MAG: DUF444 family protein [Gammaproteobacteria bacterium]
MTERSWYGLFSRGARDWLRHNEKVREAVRAQLPEIVAGADILGTDGNRKVQVPVRLLEHYRFRLADPEVAVGAGSGDADPGDVLQPGTPGGTKDSGGGNDSGEVQFVVELAIDDIVDWLWQALELPDLQARAGRIEESDWTREGWNRRGARSRLDRRRSLREAVKRRRAQPRAAAIVDEDLRYRQLQMRRKPAAEAAVFFVMDVSASMGERDRRLAKTFFFWAVQGLRRQYRHVHMVFVAHTENAWEFAEQEFFQVRGTGGTVASSAFSLVLDQIDARFPPSGCNVYMFYASDGHNFHADRDDARRALARIGALANRIGYVEVGGTPGDPASEMAVLIESVRATGVSASHYALYDESSIWEAIRAFFSSQARAAEAIS